MSVGEKRVGMIAYLISSKGFSNRDPLRNLGPLPARRDRHLWQPQDRVRLLPENLLPGRRALVDPRSRALLADYQSLDDASREDFKKTLLLAASVPRSTAIQ